MTVKQIVLATQAEADLCNALAPPAKGCNAGGGVHIVIPPDWQALIAAGQDVPGCTYHRLDADGSLVVSDQAQARLAVPAVVNALPAPLQATAPALTAALATAVVISAQVAQAQVEIAP